MIMAGISQFMLYHKKYIVCNIEQLLVYTVLFHTIMEGLKIKYYLLHQYNKFEEASID